MTFPLLSTKITIPPVRSRLVQRKRLFEILDQSGYPRLILVTAPAGYGKTTLVSRWVGKTKRKVAWFSLDRQDNDFALFLRYLIAALQVPFSGFGQATLSILDEPTLPQKSILASLVNELAALPRRTTIVLDDYHLIENQSIHDGLIFLLEHLPETVEILLASRTEPPFPLHRWRGRGQLIEIRPTDLRFTTQEVAEFLENVMGLNLTPEDIHTLETRTEGWVTGLQMAALAIQALPDEMARQREAISDFVRTFSSSHRYILDYLWDEVIARQPQDVQDFLLQTSLLERLSAPLCNAVTGIENSQTLLDSLETQNLFLIALDGERLWYRYHHLFAELLRNQLEKVATESLPELHLRASHWYEENAYADEAITHALASGQMDVAVALIERLLLDLFAKNEVELGRHWLQKFPSEIIRSRPLLCLAQSTASQYTHPFDWDRMERWAELAAQTAPELLNQPLEIDSVPYYKTINDMVRGYRILLRAHLAEPRAASPAQVIAHARHALEILPSQDLPGRSTMLMLISRAHMNAGDTAAAAQVTAEALELAQASKLPEALLSVLWAQAYIAYRQGRYRDAQQIYQRCLDEIIAPAEQHGRHFAPTASIFSFWGAILDEFNQLSEAQTLLEKALVLARLRNDLDPEVDAAIGLAILAAYRGEADACHQLDAYLPKLPPDEVTMLQTHIARAQLILGDRFPDLANAAFHWADEQVQHLDPLQQHEPIFEIWVRALLLRKRQGNANPDLRGVLEPLESQQRLAESKGYRRAWVSTLIVQTLVYQELGEAENAFQCFERALALAQPEGYVRIFINERGPMQTLLQAAIERGNNPGYARTLLVALEAELQPSGTATNPKAGALLPDPLTPRELEVLNLIAAGLSNQQIAEELVLAVGTVKKYTSNIFLKLNVNRRTQAVAKAKELGIL